MPKRRAYEMSILNQIASIVREKKRVHYSIIAMLVGRSPAWVNARRLQITELFKDIRYDHGYFYTLEIEE